MDLHWSCLCFLLVISLLGNVEAQQMSSCKQIKEKAKLEKLNIYKEVTAFVDSAKKILNDFFQIDLDLQYKVEYYTTGVETHKQQMKEIIDNLLSQFNFDMEVLNETIHVGAEADVQLKLIDKYFNLKTNILLKFNVLQKRINENYGIFDIEYLIEKTKCNPCKSPCRYNICLKAEINGLIDEFTSLKQDFKNYTAEIDNFKSFRPTPLDFIDNVKKIVQEKRLLAKNFTVEIIQDYYKNVLIKHYNEFVERSEEFYNGLITSSVKSGSTTLINILKFALDKLKPQYVQGNNTCNWIDVLNNTINAINRTITPYKRIPLWDLEEYTRQRSRSTKNVTDVYELLSIYKNAFELMSNDIRDIYPPIGYDYYPYQSLSIAVIAEQFISLDAKWKGTCPIFKINNTDDQAAYDVLSCLVAIAQNGSFTIADYLHSGLDDSHQIAKCYNETQKLL